MRIDTPTRILTQRDVRQLLDLGDCIEAVERAFRLHGTGEALPPAVASVHVPGGGFHTKAGVLPAGDRSYFAAKTNGNFPGNPARHDLPTIQGTLVLCDAERGTPLAIMDSGEITALRTAAATAVAARHLARRDASSLAIIGCGLQGERHFSAISLVRRVARVRLFDANPAAADALAKRIAERGVAVTRATDPAGAARESDICVTCTTSTEYLLGAADAPTGSFIAGVGVDAEHKRELHPGLLAASKVVVDVLAQCVAFGDLHHAVDAGILNPAAVHGELGAVVCGAKPGRESDDERIVFDSTGMALQDVAAAAVVFERAVATGSGVEVRFSS